MLYWSKITRKPQHATRVVLHAFLFGWICVADAATEVASVAQHLFTCICLRGGHAYHPFLRRLE